MRVGDCKNFRGIQHGMCKAGVDMRELSGAEPGMLTRIPCLSLHADKHCIECKSYIPQTQEDVDRHEAESEEMVAQFLIELNILKPIISRLKTEHSTGFAGSESCPVCNDGMLHYTISGVNQHVHMRCTNDGCVNFME